MFLSRQGKRALTLSQSLTSLTRGRIAVPVQPDPGCSGTMLQNRMRGSQDPVTAIKTTYSFSVRMPLP